MNHRERMRARQGVEAQRLGAGSLRADRPPQDIELHIDQLMMEGLQPSDRYQFGNAVQTALARLLAEKGIPPNLTDPVELGRLAAGGWQHFSLFNTKTRNHRMPSCRGGLSRNRADQLQ